MDVSARDIEQVEFHDAWRGYNQTEVDDFLDQVAATVERLERDNAALRTRLQEIETSVESARATEEMMKKALLTAQQTAEETIAEARAEADRVLAEATSGMDTRKHEVEASLASLQRFESETKQRLRDVLEGQLRALDALTERTPLPADPPAPQPETMAPSETIAVPSAGDPVVESVAIPEVVGAEEPMSHPDPTIAPAGEGSTGSAQDLIDEIAAGTDTDADSSLFDFEGDEEEEPPLDDFRPFDDEAALQGRRRRGLFRRRVDDWA